MTCSCCQGSNINDLDHTFGPGMARSDARHYLKKGLSRRAQKLVAYLLQRDERLGSILDIGCGAGSIHHELLRRGLAEQAVGVDASSAFLAAAQANAQALGLAGKVSYQQQDFAQSAERFQPADLVVMDRVICCYPYLESLLGPAARRATRYLALSYPIDAWWVRAGNRLADGVLRLVGSGYRPYVHAHEDVARLAKDAGMLPVHSDRHFIWQITLFRREEPARGA